MKLTFILLIVISLLGTANAFAQGESSVQAISLDGKWDIGYATKAYTIS